MSLSQLLNQPITIIRRTAGTDVDEYGNTADVEAAPVDTVGYVEQTDATEVIVDRETYITNWLIVVPAATEVDASDRIEAIGRLFEVVGEPADVWSPRSRLISHKELNAREVVG